MRLKVLESDTAIADADRLQDYLVDHAGQDTATRFVQALIRAYERLATMPGVGAIRPNTNPDLQNLRVWMVPEFPKYLIFYQATDDSLIIRRVLHGAQNVEQIINQPDE